MVAVMLYLTSVKSGMTYPDSYITSLQFTAGGGMGVGLNPAWVKTGGACFVAAAVA